MSDKNKNEYKFLSLSEFKSSDEDNGSFSGYGNNFGILDSYDDISLPGCFSEGLKNFVDSGFGGVDHRWGIKDEIGIVENAFEDATGLYIEISYHPTDDAQNIRKKINNRLANDKKCSLSIGYRVVDKEYIVGEEAAQFLINPSQKVLDYLKKKQPLVRLLKKVKLYEVSPVSVGANSASEISEAKSAVLTARHREVRNPKQIKLLNLRYRALESLKTN